MIVLAVGRNCCAIKVGLWINKQSFNRIALDMGGYGNADEIAQRGIDAHKINRAITNTPGSGDSGGHPNQWCASGFFPQCEFSPVLLFTKMPPMIAPEADNCVVFVGRSFQGIENSAHLTVEIADRCEIGLNGFLPATRLKNCRMISHGLRHFQTACRDIIQIAVLCRRQLNLIQRMHVEVLLRHVPWHMRFMESESQKEWLIVRFGQFRDSIVSNLSI